MPEDGAEAEESQEQPQEPPTQACTYEGCGDKATWSFTIPIPAKPDSPPHIHTEYFCHTHAMTIVVLYASTEENEFKPMFIQAWPIRMGGDFHPVGIFVCSLGHIGRVSVHKTGKESEGKVQYALVGNYRRCNACDSIATDIMKLANATLFGGKGKMVYKKYTNRDKDVA